MDSIDYAVPEKINGLNFYCYCEPCNENRPEWTSFLYIFTCRSNSRCNNRCDFKWCQILQVIDLNGEGMDQLVQIKVIGLILKPAKLQPDLNHPVGIDPNWDYRNILEKWFRIFKNGGMFPK